MKRLKVVAWDILNKASIQVGALRGWVFVNAIRITFVKFVFFVIFLSITGQRKSEWVS